MSEWYFFISVSKRNECIEAAGACCVRPRPLFSSSSLLPVLAMINDGDSVASTAGRVLSTPKRRRKMDKERNVRGQDVRNSADSFSFWAL